MLLAVRPPTVRPPFATEHSREARITKLWNTVHPTVDYPHETFRQATLAAFCHRPNGIHTDGVSLAGRRGLSWTQVIMRTAQKRGRGGNLNKNDAGQTSRFSEVGSGPHR